MKKIFIIIIVLASFSSYAQSDDKNLYDEFMKLRRSQFPFTPFDERGETYIRERKKESYVTSTMPWRSGLLVVLDNRDPGKYYINLKNTKLKDVVAIYYFVDNNPQKRDYPIDSGAFPRGAIFMFTKGGKVWRGLISKTQEEAIENLKKWGFKKWLYGKEKDMQDLKDQLGKP